MIASPPLVYSPVFDPNNFNSDDVQEQLNSKQTILSATNRLNAAFVGGGTVSNDEFGFLDGATSNIQEQLLGAPKLQTANTWTETNTFNAGLSAFILSTTLVKQTASITYTVSGLPGVIQVTTTSTATLPIGGVTTGTQIIVHCKGASATIATTAAGSRLYYSGANHATLALSNGSSAQLVFDSTHWCRY